MYSYGPPHMAKQKQDDQLEHTYISYVRIRDVALKTCQKRWMIGRSGERGSGISVLVAWHDDNIYIYIYIYIKQPRFVLPQRSFLLMHWAKHTSLDLLVGLLIDCPALWKELAVDVPLTLKSVINMTSTFDTDCLAFFCFDEDGDFHWLFWWLVSGSNSKIYVRWLDETSLVWRHSISDPSSAL